MLIITDKMEYLERQSRRNNLVFEGVSETAGETWADMEEKVRRVLSEKLQLERVARLLRWKDKNAILLRAKLLKEREVGVQRWRWSA